MQANSKHHIIIIPASCDPQNLETGKEGKEGKKLQRIKYVEKKEELFR